MTKYAYKTNKVKTVFKSFEGRNNLITGNTIGTDSLNFFATSGGIVHTELLEEGDGYTVIKVMIDEKSRKPIPVLKRLEYGIESFEFF